MRLSNKAADGFKKKSKRRGATKKDDELWPLVKDYLDIGIEARRPFERGWIINSAFLNGRQYTYFNIASHSLKQLKPVRGRIRKVDNQLWPRVRRQISDFIKTDPIMSVVPASLDDDDIQAAKTGDNVLKAFWQNNKMKKKTRRMAGWIFSTGNVYVDHRWNPKLGPVEVDKEAGVLEYLGDADCGIWSPFEIYVPFVAFGDDELHGFPWMIKAKWRGLDYLTLNYSRGNLVVGESMAQPIVDSALILGSSSKNMGGDVPGALLIELYVQPCSKFPKGKFIAAANGFILADSDWPFTRYSMEHFKDIDVSGVFHGKATMTDAIPLQKTWNRTVSDIEEFNRMMGKGKYLVPHGAKLSVGPDDTHGQLLNYKPVLGHKPEILQLKGMPETYKVILEVTSASFDNLFSQHEVSRGTIRSDLRSGEMVGMLREQDAHGQIPTHAVYEESMAELMSGVLKRVQKGYKKERMLQIVGKDDEHEVFAFKGADLRNNTSVRIKGQSTVPDSRIAREQVVLTRFQQGLYGDPTDPEVRRHVMNMLDDAVVKDIYSLTMRNEKVARWENRLMIQRDVKVNSYDDHAIHLKEHNHFRLGLDYQRLKMENPGGFAQLETKFLIHAAEHNRFLKEAREAQVQEMMRMGIKPGQGAGQRGGQK